MDKEMDYSDLSSAELKAISISYENSLMKTEKTTYPYLGMALEEFNLLIVGLVKSYPKESINLVKEIQAIISALHRVMPNIPHNNPDIIIDMLTPNGLKWNLLNGISCLFLIQQLTQMQDHLILELNAQQHTYMGNTSRH